jgi:hypothetical protein
MRDLMQVRQNVEVCEHSRFAWGRQPRAPWAHGSSRAPRVMSSSVVPFVRSWPTTIFVSLSPVEPFSGQFSDLCFCSHPRPDARRTRLPAPTVGPRHECWDDGRTDGPSRPPAPVCMYVCMRERACLVDPSRVTEVCFVASATRS